MRSMMRVVESFAEELQQSNLELEERSRLLELYPRNWPVRKHE